MTDAREVRGLVAHADMPSHCAVCGVLWRQSWQGVCRSCRAGLPCRADTTDTVAPDPPCRPFVAGLVLS